MRTTRTFAAALLLALVYLQLPHAVQEVAHHLTGLACAVAVVAGIRLHRPGAPAPWLLLAGGVLMWVLGDLAYFLIEVAGGEVPYTSWADALYLSAYPLAIAALAVAVRRTDVRDRAAWLDAAIGTLAVAVLIWEPLIEPNLDADAALAARLTPLVFPAMDLLLLMFVLRLLAGQRWRSGPLGLLGLSVVAYLIADLVQGVQALHGSHVDASVVHFGWLLAYIGIGTVALSPGMVALTEPGAARQPTSSRWRLVSLVGAAMLAPGMLSLRQMQGDVDDALPFALAAGLMLLLVGARCAGVIAQLETAATSLRARERDLERQATTDVLTGLANRAVLRQRLEQGQAAGCAFSVALLDLDEFKHVNDSRGHEIGDALLVQVAGRIAASLVPGDVAARLGGDEFAVVSSQPSGDLARRLTAVLSVPVVLDGLGVHVSASVGLVQVDAGPPSAERRASELLRSADIAMYVAKSAGGGAAVEYSAQMSTDLLHKLDLRGKLTLAVDAGQFAAWLQPVVDLQSGRVVGFEALARWERPGQAPEAPGSWLAAAEETGLVVRIDEQVLRAAVRQLVAWTARSPEAARMTMAVNASGRTLQEPDFADRLLRILSEEGLAPHRLVLEVTEGVLIDGEHVGSRLQQLRQAGVQIALDDFGTGWSSLAYLRRFPVDVLKIDRSFVTGIADGDGGRAVPAAVLQLAEALHLDVIAEGVETPEQAETLRRLGCRSAQGYLLARPSPPAELEALVRRGHIPLPLHLVAAQRAPAV